MDFSDQIIINSLPRTYHVHVATADFEPPSWLLLAFHGGGGTGRGMNWLTHFNSIADRERFVVAYPDGWETLDDQETLVTAESNLLTIYNSSRGWYKS